MSDSSTYDVVIIGGGLAGLSAAILLSRKRYKVLVLEKESYPRHKVCGEYISMESKPFLESIGVSVDELSLPVIDQLMITDARGNEIKTALPQGGFGISRYQLDNMLAKLAQEAGATIVTRMRADSINFENEVFTVGSGKEIFTAKVVCGTWGKRSNIDVKWERPFIKKKNSALNNYVGIKYHVRFPWPDGYIGLHNFTNGYCGISQIEDGKHCLCYLTTADNLQKHCNNIKKMEQAVLMKNKWLQKIFSEAAFLYENPVAISQISFDKKEQVYERVLLLGDAAGMITPLCGNGMSMALHSSKIATAIIDDFLQGSISRTEMEQQYTLKWESIFSNRITLGRIIQSNFGKDRFTSIFLKAATVFPFVKNSLIRGTSGRPF